MVLDMAGAYGAAGLRSLERRFVFDPVTGGLAGEDRFVFSAPLPVIERFVSLYPPQAAGSAVRIDSGDSRTLLTCSPAAAPRIHEQTHTDHGGNELTVYLIDFPLAPEAPDLRVRWGVASEG
jgi:hypothetical protein